MMSGWLNSRSVGDFSRPLDREGRRIFEHARVVYRGLQLFPNVVGVGNKLPRPPRSAQF